MDEAEYCNRVSIMVDGKIEALDTPTNLKKQFEEKYGRSFLPISKRCETKC
jgi:ABC-2 type transport system ATP-binding protein